MFLSPKTWSTEVHGVNSGAFRCPTQGASTKDVAGGAAAGEGPAGRGGHGAVSGGSAGEVGKGWVWVERVISVAELLGTCLNRKTTTPRLTGNHAKIRVITRKNIPRRKENTSSR